MSAPRRGPDRGRENGGALAELDVADAGKRPAKLIADETEKWAKVIRGANVKAQW
jgi:hypothetical protein